MNTYKILTIVPNDKDMDNDFINLIIGDTNNITLDNFNKHMETFNFELENCLSSNEIIYYREFNYDDTLENQINEIYIDNIKSKVNISKIDDKIYSSSVIKYTDDYYIVAYFNNCLLDIYLNVDLNKLHDPKKEFNLLGSIMMRELNIKSNTLFGEIFLIKFDNNGNIIPISSYELFYILKDLLYVQYYTEIGIPGIYVDKKDNYKSFFNKEEVKIYDKYKLLCFNNDNKKVWNKYYLRFNKNIENDDLILQLSDKYNLIMVNNIDEIFCYDNIEDKDIEIIKKLSLE
jgi:hypothetical protein